MATELRLAPLPRAGQRAPDRAADAITRFAGSMLLIYRHLAWFVLWTVSNVAAPSRFDRHPCCGAMERPHRRCRRRVRAPAPGRGSAASTPVGA